METFDLAVIGAGPGGYPAAIRAAQLGCSVALIEKERLGGTCLNWGCIPTKTLISASSLLWTMNHSERLGVKAGKISFDYSAMVGRKNQVVDRLRSGIAQLLKANGVTVFEGVGSFTGRNRISIRNSRTGTTRIEAGKSVIATGSAATLPEWLPKGKSIADSRSFLELTGLPQTMIILGGGIIGCELACMAAQLGVSVTIVEILPDILPMLDADLRAEARRHMEHQLKIRILTGKPLEHITAGRAGVKAQNNGQAIEADLLLVAVGRRPVTEDLALKTAGVTTNARGYIDIDEHCRTKAATIYAIGDVIGGPQLAHAATAQGLMTAEHIAGVRRYSRSRIVPCCIFTAPEIGTAGLSEQEAREQNRAITVGKFPFSASGKAIASDETAGFVKWIADASTDQLLGAQAVGPHATELIAEATLAIQSELTARELAQTIHSHPTLSEAWMEAAHAVHGQCIHTAPRKKQAPKSNGKCQ